MRKHPPGNIYAWEGCGWAGRFLFYIHWQSCVRDSRSRELVCHPCVGRQLAGPRPGQEPSPASLEQGSLCTGTGMRRDEEGCGGDRANFSPSPQLQEPSLPIQRTRTQAEEIKRKNKHLTGCDLEHTGG